MRPMPELTIRTEKVADLIPYAGNAKLHPFEQVDQIATSIEEFGFDDPIAVWHNDAGEMEIVEGHGRLLALKKMGIEECPVIYLDHLSDAQRRAYILAHNKLTMNSGFDFGILSEELDKLADEFDMGEFGFDMSAMMTDDDIDEFFIEAVRKADDRDQEAGPSDTEDGRKAIEQPVVMMQKTVTCPECGHIFEL